MSHVHKRGFTLIELVLAMSFISVLLLTIAMTVLQVGTTYNRGITLKEVNQTGRTLAETFRYDITAAQALSLDKDGYVQVTSGGTALGGRLCLGGYSYVWNYGRAENSSSRIRYERAPEGVANEVYFVKVSDPSRQYCLVDPDTNQPIRTAIAEADTGVSQELLKKGDRQLRMHNFSIRTSDNVTDAATGQQLYTISFTLGAGELSAMNTDQTACLEAGDPNADLAYCAVQTFTIVVRAGSGAN